MTTEFGEIIIEDEFTKYKFINPTLKVFTDGCFAKYNLEEDEWEDEEGKKGYITYFDKIKKTGSKEKMVRLVARAFIPNPMKLNTVNHKDGDIKNCEVDNLEWGKTNRKPAVGYVIQGDKYQVRMYSAETKKTKFYGSYNTALEAEARVAEVRNINI